MMVTHYNAGNTIDRQVILSRNCIVTTFCMLLGAIFCGSGQYSNQNQVKNLCGPHSRGHRVLSLAFSRNLLSPEAQQ